MVRNQLPGAISVTGTSKASQYNRKLVNTSKHVTTSLTQEALSIFGT